MFNTFKIDKKLSTLFFTLICLYSYLVNQYVCLDYNESNKKNEIELTFEQCLKSLKLLPKILI